MNRLIFVCATLLVLISRSSVSIAESSWALIPDSVDPKTTRLTDLGPANPDTSIEFDVGLLSKDPVGEAQFIQELYDPSSPNFHKYLTPEEFCQRFGPDPQLFESTRHYFAAQGIALFPQVGCLILQCGGSVRQIESTLNTTMELYEFNGAPAFANSTPLMVPNALMGIVSSVSGLDALIAHPTPGLRP
jgi:subtilase family serine protease